jgi:hypothetical protein
MQRILRVFAVGLAALAVAASLPSLASAHESREVLGGQYRLVVGFLNEPASVDDKSGLDLRVTDNPAAADGQEPERTGVEGLETTLQAEVIYGAEKMTLPLEPRFRDPGAYASYFYPSVAGDYSFHIWGTINGEQIDETFTSGPETFGPIEERIVFPQQSATTNGTVAGTVSGGDGGVGTGGIFGGLAVGLALGAAGVWRLLRRDAVRRPALARPGLNPGIGD